MMPLEKCLDPQLWHACAGGMVQIPLVDSMVYYFPEGHAEQTGGGVDFSGCPAITAMILCRVASVKYLADRDTDEVFVKMVLAPMVENEPGSGEGDGRMRNGLLDAGEKPASFAKTLTPSDANNGGGFSIPRYCAETIFPKLDYSTDPPVQTVFVKDVHGELWKFRHIYRGTPRRHLLTTGWSNFVNQKKLVAGDSVVFLRADDGDLCIGIRRAKRGISNGVAFPSTWNQFANCFAAFTGSPVLLAKQDSKASRGNGSSGGSGNVGSGMRVKGKVSSASVVEAATLSARGQPFEVVYYPRAGSPEFCVAASTVRDAMRIRWAAGMRFKMAFETEDSSRISWFLGTITGTQVGDPGRWPSSPWRILQVAWDEPDLLQNVKSVNPWLIELVNNMPALHVTAFSPPLKKMCLAQPSESRMNERVPASAFPSNPLLETSTPMHYLPNYAPAGIQGARHTQLDLNLTNLQHSQLQQSLFLAGTRDFNFRQPITPATIGNKDLHFPIAGSTSLDANRSPKQTHIVLFGKLILTEEQLSGGSSAETVSTTGNSSSDANTEKSNLSDSMGFSRSSRPAFANPENLNTFTVDSSDKLDAGFSDIFGIKKAGMVTRMLYQNQVDAQGEDGLHG